MTDGVLTIFKIRINIMEHLMIEAPLLKIIFKHVSSNVHKLHLNKLLSL